MPFQPEGVSEEFLYELRQAAQSLSLNKIRGLKARFERKLTALRRVHPEAEEISYAGPINPANDLDQIRLCQEVVDICDVQINGRERKPTSSPEDQGNELERLTSAGEFTHSDDYSTGTFRGVKFALTTRQAQIVEFLHREYLSGVHEVRQARVLEYLGSGSSRWGDAFRGTNLYGKGRLIVPGSRRGLVRLNIPKHEA